MSAEAGLADHSHDIPQAPPLPAPKAFQGVRNAAYRMIGLPSRPPSPKLARIELNLPTFNRFAALGISQDATTSHRTGLEINTLSINDAGSHALIGGKEIFKTVRVNDGICVEDRNLRTAIRSTPTQASGHVRQVYSIDIADVAWAKGDCGDYVAAATTSGKIILYDLGHAALQATLLHEHYRQVHKVTFNPHRGSLLLSGSQDGTVRLWDVRDVRSHASTLQSKRKFSGQSDGVRDVKWSPTEGVDFAFGTDSGWIQRWDIRNLKVPKIRIPAHHSSCTSLDWHPDGKHLLSAGIDKVMRIWDYAAPRIHKPSWEIRAPYPISNARWRPACESSMPQDNGARICTQVVAAYTKDHPVVHIWDMRRPSIPFRVIAPYVTAPTDMLWHSQDLLWTVGREGIFQQTDIQHTTKPIDRRNLQAMAVAADGAVTFALQQRHQKATPRHYSLPKLQTPGSSLSQSPESTQLSRSWADDSLDHSFLSIHGARQSTQVKLLAKPSRVNSTPPSGLMKTAVIKLDEVLLHRQSFAPVQSVFTGLSQMQQSRSRFDVAEAALIKAITQSNSGDFLSILLEQAFDTLAQAAQSTKNSRLAETWRNVSFATLRHLRARGFISDKAAAKKIQPWRFEHMVEDILDRASSPRPSSMNSPSSAQPANAIVQALALTESTSNVPTPLARAVPHEQKTRSTNHSHNLPDVDTGADLDPLPPSLTARHSMLANGGLEVSQKSSNSIILRNTQPSSSGRPPLLKHDSDESFVFMLGSQSSPSNGPSSVASAESPASMVKERPTRPVLKINSASPLPSELHAALSESLGSDVNISPTAPIIYPRDDVSEQELAASMLGSKELIRPTSAQHEEIVALKASTVHDIELEEPFTLVDMLHELVVYYTQTMPTVQTAAHLLLLMLPLLPETHALDQQTSKTCIAAYAESIAAEGFARNDVTSILNGALRHLLSAGVNPLQAESVLLTHHDQLQALGQHVAAAHLRKLAYPTFSSVYDCGLDQDEFVLACGFCKQRLPLVGDALTCEACRTNQLACSVCSCMDSPFGAKRDGRLRTFCLLCTHSTHVNCASEWFVQGNGRRCPTEGCLCLCPARG